MKIKKINELRRHRGVEIQHILRKENKVANYFVNVIFFFVGTKNIIFQSIQQVPKQG